VLCLYLGVVGINSLVGVVVVLRFGLVLVWCVMFCVVWHVLCGVTEVVLLLLGVLAFLWYYVLLLDLILLLGVFTDVYFVGFTWWFI